MGKSLSALAGVRAWQVNRGYCGLTLAENSGKSLPLNGVVAVKIMPDFGTLRENQAAFEVAVAYINSGESEYGRSILAALRDHICNTGEQKSVQWILPTVLEILEARKS